ncbi:DNA-processing protein DprA [Paenibacillus daejeonensis]|uniref:DNA-processing protein DprA n=1 Tax=Paenibacillus daejeonensis TaxID=135193 RepID=UPI00059488E0|nr:DNA-processing protein DprA [Paenibacillus daejeonensis]
MHEIQGIGWHTIAKAMQASVMDCVSYSEANWKQLGIKSAQSQALARTLSPAFAEERADHYRRLGVRVITWLDDDYPRWLRHIPQPPWVLYAKGRIELLEGPMLAVVGTRVPTAYGRHMARELSSQLAARGLSIVSGLARGIDRCAHEAALQEPGGTIAVLGTPLDIAYPREHSSLQHRIAQEGLVLSEYPVGTACHPGMFPVRNRIIAGLSLGTLVIEAASRSGSLITADQALDMGREVFALPGPANSPKSTGTNEYIRDLKAKLTLSVDDILAELAVRLMETSAFKPSPAPGPQPPTLTAEESRIYELLQDEPATADVLHAKTGMSFGHLHAVLINLTIKRKIEQHPGSIYCAL